MDNEIFMIIEINYDSKWGNSFLSEPDEKGKRTYVAATSRLKSPGNKDNALGYYKEKEISLSTVYGILYRLLGARKSLSKLLESDDSILSTLIKEDKISFKIEDEVKWEELVFLRNTTGSYDQNSYSGIPNEDLLSLKGIVSAISVLFYSREQLMDFILSSKHFPVKLENLSILEIAKKIEESGKNPDLKISEDEFNAVNEAMIDITEKEIHQKASLALLAINKSMILYCKEKGLSSEFLTANNTFAGISLNGNTFTLKDFMKKFANPKTIYGNPYVANYKEKNPITGKYHDAGKKLNKSSGILQIEIDADFDTENDLKELIENAGVGPFYVGKKGLAYVKNIIL